MCDHRWSYRSGRSWCPDCGAWALDLRCCPGLRQDGGRYPTATDLQNDFACVCGGNLRARVVDGDLRVICDDCGGDAIEAAAVISKKKRDWVYLQQEIEAQEVLDGLPAHLRELLE